MIKDLLYKPISLKGDPKDFLFTGCPHLNHDPRHWPVPIWKQRGFESAEDAKISFIQNWNARANNFTTTGFILGDFMFGSGGEKEFFGILSQLNFKKLFILPGNHTAGFKQGIAKSDENGQVSIIRSDETEGIIQFCPNYCEFFINGQAVALSHYPVLSWNGQAKGSILLHAHVHDSLQRTPLGREYQRLCRAVEVSIEKSIAPFTFDEILLLVKDKPAFAPDHHDANTQNPF